MMNSNNYCVIMGGGIGSRFWPYSRKNMPKQFLDFLGTGQTLIQLTFNRYSKVVPLENIFVVTNIQYKDLVMQQLPDLPEDHILLEPTRRNTAPCIAWACMHIEQINPHANIIVAPADHLILKDFEFIDSLTKGLEFVNDSNQLLVLGVKPTRHETGYGYIQIDEQQNDRIYKVKTFIEKPEEELAKMLIESGEFYWNSGIFLWNVNTIMNVFNDVMPEIPQRIKQGEEGFASCPNISIDLGILEKVNNVHVQICDIGWADIGTWAALHEVVPKDEHQNVSLHGNNLLYNCRNNMITAPKGKLVVLQDLDNYLIADTDNVLLICKKDDANAIRKYVNDVQIKLGEDYI